MALQVNQEFAGPLPLAGIENSTIFTGSCHCGNVTVAVKAKPLPSKGQTLPEIRGPGSPFAEHTEYVQECNCSICMRVCICLLHRNPAFYISLQLLLPYSTFVFPQFVQLILLQNGTIFFYPLRPQVSISDPTNSLTAYMMGRKFQQHKFCSICGVSVHIGKEGLPEEAANWPDTIQSIWPEIVPVNLRILDGVNWDQIVVKRSCKAEEIEPKYVVD
jgi:hypothetical protein